MHAAPAASPMTRFVATPPQSNFPLRGVCIRHIVPVCTASQSHKPAHHDLSRFPAIHMLYGYSPIPFPCSNWELFFAGLPYPSQVLPLSPCIMTKWRKSPQGQCAVLCPHMFYSFNNFSRQPKRHNYSDDKNFPMRPLGWNTPNQVLQNFLTVTTTNA